MEVTEISRYQEIRVSRGRIPEYQGIRGTEDKNFLTPISRCPDIYYLIT